MSGTPNTCKECPYTVKQKRNFGMTIHCTLDPTGMDVTHVEGRSLFCRLTNKPITEEIPVED